MDNKLLSIKIKQEDKLFKETTFNSFKDADNYLCHEALKILPDRTFSRVYFFYIVWENGYKFNDFIPISYTDRNKEKVLESYLQMVFEDNMHVAGDSSYKLIAQASWQVDRISLNLETVKYFRNMCLSCEGLDREKYLVDMQKTKEMIAKIENQHPLLLNVIFSGREMFNRIFALKDRSVFLKKEVFTYIKKSLTKAIESALCDNYLYAQQYLNEARILLENIFNNSVSTIICDKSSLKY